AVPLSHEPPEFQYTATQDVLGETFERVGRFVAVQQVGRAMRATMQPFHERQRAPSTERTRGGGAEGSLDRALLTPAGGAAGGSRTPQQGSPCRRRHAACRRGG